MATELFVRDVTEHAGVVREGHYGQGVACRRLRHDG